jgi:hypothetical protein
MVRRENAPTAIDGIAICSDVFGDEVRPIAADVTFQ